MHTKTYYAATAAAAVINVQRYMGTGLLALFLVVEFIDIVSAKTILGRFCEF